MVTTAQALKRTPAEKASATMRLTCPNCSAEFGADRALEAEIARRAGVEAELVAQQRIAAERRKAAAEAEARSSLERENLARSLEEERQASARLLKGQLEALEKVREMERRGQELELEVQRRAAQERETAVREATSAAEERHKLESNTQEAENQKLRRQIDELKRSADGTVAVTRGDAGEAELGDRLGEEFPSDQFEKVAKGKKGGDWIQTLNASHGRSDGILLWEAKNQKNLDRAWFAKAREDQHQAGADAVILVWYLMPADHPAFSMRDGVVLIHPSLVETVGSLVREKLLAVRSAAAAQAGRETKESQVYDYLCSGEFARELERTLAPLVELRESVDRQFTAIEREYAKQHKLIAQAMSGGAQVVGTLQALTQNALQEVPMLALPSGIDEAE